MPFPIDPDFIITTLRQSALKNTTFVLVEDKISEEQQITTVTLEPYRFMRRQLMKENIDFISCSGVKNLMAVFRRRNEFADRHVIFYRDRDLLIHTGIPAELNVMLFTRGYSIENDVYAETGIEEMILTQGELDNHAIAKRNFILWYSAMVHQNLNRQETSFRLSPLHVLSNTYDLKPAYQLNVGEIADSSDRFNEIFGDYAKMLRGHSLFELLVVFLRVAGRAPQYNSNQLMDYCVDQLSPPLFMQTINEIEQRHTNHIFT